MNFDYLREFLDLANTLNFTKSASNLQMTQSTLSRHIAAMEKEIGAPLFVRSTSKVKLTQNGRLLYERSSALLSDYADTIEEMKAEISRAVETLSVSTARSSPRCCACSRCFRRAQRSRSCRSGSSFTR